MLTDANKTGWDSWSDSRTLMLRPLPGTKGAYEYLVDMAFLEGRRTYIRHGVIFLDDYMATKEGTARLEKTLSGFGYGGITDFLAQNLDEDEEPPATGIRDEACTERILRLLTALIVESLVLGTEDDRSVCFEDEEALKAEIGRILGDAEDPAGKEDASHV